MERIFYHGIFPNIPCISITKMIEIIQSGAIKSRRLQGVTSKFGYNGDDYISICSKEDEKEYFKYPINAYDTYILNGFCFIISDDIPAIKVRYTEVYNDFDFETIIELMSEKPEQRYSDMFDEWQVKDEISLNQIIGIGIPYDEVSKLNGEFKIELDILINIATSMGWDIVNTSDAKDLDDYERRILNDEKINSMEKRKLYE